MAHSFKGATLLWLLAALTMPIALGGAFYRVGLNVPFPVFLLAIPVCAYFAFRSYRRPDPIQTANTLKPAVILWVLGAFPLWAVVMRLSEGQSLHLNPLLVFVVVLSICCGLAAKAYRSGQGGAASSFSPATIKPAYVTASIAGLAVIIGATWYTTRPTIEGKYRTSTGANAEFLPDGTLIFTSNGQQGIWKWAKAGDSRLKLDPSAGMLGTKSTVCDYSLPQTGIILKNCDLAMNLTRLPK